MVVGMEKLHKVAIPKIFVFAVFITFALISHAEMYAFHIDQDMLSGAPVSHLNEPINAEHSIHVNGEHFYTLGSDLSPGTSDDRRIRFWGINLSPPMTFPESKRDAERLAVRLEKLGFNLVRLHAIDMMPTKPYMSILAKTDQSYPVLNNKNLESLKMLVKSLKQHGIYVDLVLKLGYAFDSEKDCILIEGLIKCVPDPAIATKKYMFAGKMPILSKPLDLFNKEMIELQKSYFRMILGHFKGDPVLAMIEISNENSLIETFSENDKRIPPLYAEELDKLWVNWLSEKYKNIITLKAAWRKKTSSSGGVELLVNGDFKRVKGILPVGWKMTQWPLDGIKQWGGWKVTKNQELKIDINHIPNKYWYMFLTQAGQKIREGDIYSVTIRAKSTPPRKIQISVNVENNGKTINANRYKHVINIDEEYRDYRICFKSIVSNNNARLTLLPIQPDSGPGELWIDEISFSSAEQEDSIIASTSIEEVTRPLLKNNNLCPESRAKEEDYLRFLADKERLYYEEIKSFLNNEIGVRAPITGTQANYGGLLGNKIMSEGMDYIDVHYYWDHPNTKNRDYANWWMTNKSMVENPEESILRTIASTRVSGKPFTISEYGMNLANEYAQEGFILGAAYGAYQDIDAIMVFDYNAGGSGYDSRKRMQPDRLTSWYNILGDTRSEALMPVAAEIFRNADLVGPSEKNIINIDDKMRLEPVLNGWSIRNHYKILSDKNYNNLSINIDNYLNSKTSLNHVDREHKSIKKSSPTPLVENNLTRQGAQKISITHVGDNKPYVKIETATVNVVTGYIGKPIVIGNIQLMGEKGSDQFCTVSISSLDGNNLNESNSMLIRAVGKGKNKNTQMIKAGSGYRICVVDGVGKCVKPYFHPDAGEFVMKSCNLLVSVNRNAQKLVLESLNEKGDVINKRTATRKDGRLNINLDDGISHSLWHNLHLQ